MTESKKVREPECALCFSLLYRATAPTEQPWTSDAPVTIALLKNY